MRKNLHLRTDHFYFLSLILLITSFQILIESSKLKVNKQTEWTPEKIKEVTNFQSGLADPEGYLENYEDKSKIYDMIDEIKKIKNIDVTIYLISKISDKYMKKGKKDISKFVDDLSALIVHRNRESDSRSLIVVFSVLDRQMQIRSGEEVKKVIDNFKIARMLKGIKNELKKANYGLATKKLLKNIFDEVTEMNGSVLASIFALSMILGALWCICYSMVRVARSDNLKNLVKRNLYDEEAENKLKKIKIISDKNISKQDYVDKNCVVCLENFNEEFQTKLENLKKCNNFQVQGKNSLESEEIFNFSPKINKIEIPGIPTSPSDSNTILSVAENKNQAEKINDQEKFNNDILNQSLQSLQSQQSQQKSPLEGLEDQISNKGPPLGVTKLNCGHVFHSNCIAKWHEKQNKCPICRNLIDSSSDETASHVEPKHFQQGLVEIQTEMHPSLINYDYTFGQVFVWIAPSHFRHGSYGGANLQSGNNQDTSNYYNTSGFFEGGWNNAGGVEDFW